MSALRIKNQKHLRGVLGEHIDLSIWELKNPQGLSMLWEEIRNREARIVKEGERILREVWVATITLYHKSGPIWQQLTADRNHDTSVSGKYAHLRIPFRESPLAGVLREMEEELQFSDLRMSQKVSSRTIFLNAKPFGKYPGLDSRMHIKEYAGIIRPEDFKPEGYMHRQQSGFTERFQWIHVSTPPIFQNQFS